MNQMKQIAASLGLPETWEQKNGSWWICQEGLDVRLMAEVMRAREARFVTLTAMQVEAGGRVRLDYHWDLGGRLLTFTTHANGKQMASIVDLCPAADWVERETHETFSIEFTGHLYEPLLLRAGATTGMQLRKEGQ